MDYDIKSFDELHEKRYEEIKTNLLNAVTEEEVLEIWSLHRIDVKLIKYKEPILYNHLQTVSSDILNGIKMLEKGQAKNV